MEVYRRSRLLSKQGKPRVPPYPIINWNNNILEKSSRNRGLPKPGHYMNYFTEKNKAQSSAVTNIPLPNDSTLLEKFEIYIRPLAATCLFTESAWPRELRAKPLSRCLFICFILIGSIQGRFYQSISVNLSKTLMRFKNSIAETLKQQIFPDHVIFCCPNLAQHLQVSFSQPHARDIINFEIIAS